MPRDPATARLWMLASLAGAAGLLWLLALFGLGGWIGADESAAVPPWTLPARESAAARFGSADTYAEIAARPLFTSDRRPQPFVIDADDTVRAGGPDFILTGVIITPALEVAILTPNDGGEPVRVQRGQELPGRRGWQLLSLAPRLAVFQTPDGLIRFELRGTDDPAAAHAPAPAPPAGMAAAPAASTLNGTVRNPEHQARLDAARGRIAERRAQLRAGTGTSSNQPTTTTPSGGNP